MRQSTETSRIAFIFLELKNGKLQTLQERRIYIIMDFCVVILMIPLV